MKNRRNPASLRLFDNFLIAAIDCYQEKISPRKGWRCSHGVLHGGTGCSGFVKIAIRQHGWRVAWFLTRNRFHECKLAAQQLRAKHCVAGCICCRFTLPKPSGQ